MPESRGTPVAARSGGGLKSHPHAVDDPYTGLSSGKCGNACEAPLVLAVPVGWLHKTETLEDGTRPMTLGWLALASFVGVIGAFAVRMVQIARHAGRAEQVLLVALAIPTSVWLGLSTFTATTVFGNGPHWSAESRELVVVDRTGDPDWRSAIEEAATVWNGAGADLHLSFETGDGECGFDGTRIGVCLGDTRVDGPFDGMSRDMVDNGHIQGAYIEVCDDCDLDQARRNEVMVHELGHALGLDHSDDPNSIMWFEGGPELDEAYGLLVDHHDHAEHAGWQYLLFDLLSGDVEYNNRH
jgi:hypothetical protein